ncbi:MAG TPA: serine--tRNA ligase [Geminicoccus sp.]|uniref:serine--tRNA ligase n=1 Tax=Geminicoccus sp. TaxID=2024832 RepID=UPI002E2FBCA3|nr:serine--tRNA ligase [Geminicoccus sp.]HEX2529178.1 serine--tRNA ligase [Geminicoccus sp.]
MFDLRWLRENAEAFDDNLRRRGAPAAAAGLLALDAERRRIETELQEFQSTRNRLSRSFGQAKAKGEPADHLQGELAELKDKVKAGEERLAAVQAELDASLATFPNILQADVPEGADESDNVELRRVGSPRSFAFTPLPHDELGARLGMDFPTAAKMSGARFVLLRGQIARLERAIAMFMLDLQTGQHGYSETSPPLLVNDRALFGTNQLPKFAEDLFQTTTGHYLIPTAEVPLTNVVAGEILDGAQLPLRMTACTPCFRSEAGSAGRDTKGMIRQHQFSKVELVSITTPEASAAEHERMTACAEEVLKRLELPYRVMLLCAGDTGFGASKTYDIEVWLPGQGTYREISSCSNCQDFQARRMNARYRPAPGEKPRFVHTLNGSGLAVGRTLVAVLENGQEADGSVTLPAALRPYVGQDRLLPA